MSIYLEIENGETGPHTPEEILEMLADGRISRQHLAWREGMAEWRPLAELLPPQASSPIEGLPPVPPIGTECPGREGVLPTGINWIPALVLQAVSLVFGIIIDLVKLGGDDDSAQRIALLTLPVFVVTIVLSSILHYRCWRALPTRYAKTTPGKAVGYLFIPFYNFYWVFVSVVELAKGFVSHAREAKATWFGDPTGVAIAFAILFICTFTIGLIPGIASLIAIASFVLFILYYRVVVQYANDAIASYLRAGIADDSSAQAPVPDSLPPVSPMSPPPFSGVKPRQNP